MQPSTSKWKRTAIWLLCLSLLLSAKEYGVSDLIDWEAWLPAIAFVESTNDPKKISFRGASYGRGKYMISESCLKEFKDWVPGTSWITPEMLFNEKINRDIAFWYLRHLTWKYKNRKDVVAAVLSAYSGGQTLVNDGWLDWDYVHKVMRAMRRQ